jgi:hypothetical protein
MSSGTGAKSSRAQQAKAEPTPKKFHAFLSTRVSRVGVTGHCHGNALLLKSGLAGEIEAEPDDDMKTEPRDAMQFFQKLGDGDKKQEDREKEHHAYVQKAQENLTAFLQGLLQEEQFKRLRQVMLQREGLFALATRRS